MRAALKHARQAKGLMVQDIAGKLGISESFYYKIEQGVRNPTIDLAKKIANLLGGTVDELFFTLKLDESSRFSANTGTDGP
ncbi:MAG: helix-turn-helix transcriptional regulator [Candidatus Desulforudaceae bacterium]